MSAAARPGGHLDGRGHRLDGRVALVTGAGSHGDFLGTGAATALLLAAQGATVAVIDSDADRAEATCARIRDDGGTALALIADITDDAAVHTAVDALVDRTGRLDIVVNNAGIATGDWDTVFAVNATGTMLVSQAAHPHLVRTGGGSIINVSSVAAMRGFGSGAYGASKGAVQSLTTDLAYQWGPDHIRVNCLVPGHLHTPIGAQGGAQGRDLRRRANLLGTEGDAWDIAWAVLFLASDESRWITATVLPVDAGATAVTALAILDRFTDTPSPAAPERTTTP
ncbi:dehydrogenase [Mycobacteroides abscessus]|uniref:SDR family NAD(P)-dependent oxidoreductase n=1 Tax=Mycobacteroides abscessus TaxID=36809 RepID=UPI0005E85124|nr:SDR family NAD(P)-dependent oxidoreductase [Mycobacteroides abscessus]CPT92129.1 dehydrogenase [Mycobacteroides abscessus]CPW41008.1 dehydrogenase [Mycobacteroides abscessus]